MSRLWLLLLLISGPGTAISPSYTAGLVTSGLEALIDISAQLGSDLHFPVADACQFNGSYHYDLFNSKHKKIGVYDGDELQPMSGYEDRLTYDQTCTITLKKLTAQDGTRFTVTLKKDMKTGLTSHGIQYRINITDPLTSPPYIESATHPPAELIKQNTSQISPDGLRRFVLLCLSLDMAGNALFPIVLGQISSKVLGRISGFCNWEILRGNGVEFGHQINSCLTFVTQFISFIFLYRENVYGWLLVLVPIILLIDTLIDILKCLGRLPKRLKKNLQIGDNKYKKAAVRGWSVVVPLIQIFFPVFVGLLYYMIDDCFLTILGKWWYWLCISLLVSFIVKVGVFFIGVYFYKVKLQHLSPSAHKNGPKNTGPQNTGPQNTPGDPQVNEEAEVLVQQELQKVATHH